MLAQARTPTEAGGGDYYGYTLQGPAGTSVGAAFRIAIYLAQAGASLCSDPACTEPYFDNPAAVPVMAFLRELSRYTPPGLILHQHEGQVYEALYQGLSAYQIAGSWHPLARSAGVRTVAIPLYPRPRTATGQHCRRQRDLRRGSARAPPRSGGGVGDLPGAR